MYQNKAGLGIATDPSGYVAVCGVFQGNIDFGTGVLADTTGYGDAFVAKLAP